MPAMHMPDSETTSTVSGRCHRLKPQRFGLASSPSLGGARYLLSHSCIYSTAYVLTLCLTACSLPHHASGCWQGLKLEFIRPANIRYVLQAVSGRLPDDPDRQKLLQEGRMFLQYQHLQNGPQAPGNILLACHVPNRSDVEGPQGVGIGDDLRRTYAPCESVSAVLGGALPATLQLLHLGPLHAACALVAPVSGKSLLLRDAGQWYALHPNSTFSIPNSDVRQSNLLLKEHLFQLLQNAHQKAAAIEGQ